MTVDDRAEIQRLERMIGWVLLGGVTVSAVLLSIGLALWIGVPSARARNIPLQAGLIVLMVTPALRVLISCAEYVRDRDWLFAGLTGIVLAVLGSSILVGFLK